MNNTKLKPNRGHRVKSKNALVESDQHIKKKPPMTSRPREGKPAPNEAPSLKSSRQLAVETMAQHHEQAVLKKLESGMLNIELSKVSSPNSFADPNL